MNTSTSTDNDTTDTSRVKNVALAMSAGKETISELETWVEDVAVRLRRRGPLGKDCGLAMC